MRPQPEPVMLGAQRAVGPGRHTCGENGWWRLACGGSWMSPLENRTLFLLCTMGFLSTRWPGNKLRLKQETTAITDVQGSSWPHWPAMLGWQHWLSKREDETDAKDPRKLTSQNASVTRLEGGGGLRKEREELELIQVLSPGSWQDHQMRDRTQEEKWFRGRQMRCPCDSVWWH